MADLSARDSKLIQYLNEAYSKEKQLETSLQAHIAMTTRPPYKKRLQQHLTETPPTPTRIEGNVADHGGEYAFIAEAIRSEYRRCHPDPLASRLQQPKHARTRSVSRATVAPTEVVKGFPPLAIGVAQTQDLCLEPLEPSICT